MTLDTAVVDVRAESSSTTADGTRSLVIGHLTHSTLSGFVMTWVWRAELRESGGLQLLLGETEGTEQGVAKFGLLFKTAYLFRSLCSAKGYSQARR